jgi:hypothetical protein
MKLLTTTAIAVALTTLSLTASTAAETVESYFKRNPWCFAHVRKNDGSDALSFCDYATLEKCMRESEPPKKICWPNPRYEGQPPSDEE